MALAAALLGWMFDGFEMGIFPLVARPALIDVLGLSDTANVDQLVGLWNGRITAAFLVGAALGGWTFGWLGDRVGRVRAMVLSVLTYALFTGFCGLAQGPWQLAGLRFLAALGMGGEWALGVALVMEIWPGHTRPVLAGMIGAAANVGFVLTGFVKMGLEASRVDVAQGGWRVVLFVSAFPALLTFFILRFVPESEKWRHAAATTPRVGLTAIFAPALWRRTLLGAVLSGIPLLVTWGLVQWIPLWVGKMTGDQQMVNFAQITSGCGAVLGSFCGAVLGNRFSRRWAYCGLCLSALLVSSYLFGYFGSHPIVSGDWHFLVTVTALGACTAAFYGWIPLYLPELFPTRVRATGQGFGYNSGRMIAAVGALSTGILMNEVFQGSYARAGTTISLIYVAGLAVIWLAPETRGQPLPE
jgi:MFS family permease